MVSFYYNAVRPAQGAATGLQSKRHHHPKQGDNATKTQGATRNKREGKCFRGNRKANPK